MKIALTILFVMGIAWPSAALGQAPTARVGDITHLQGQGTNRLIAMGLVAGLDGTGDGGKYRAAMDQLSALLGRFGTQINDIADIENAKNIAVVSIEVIVPENGAREGELLDVSVTAHAAKSLLGGRLISTPLIYHDKNVEGLFGFASGAITVDPEVATSGTIRNGARMERDVLITVIASGTELHNIGFASSWIQSDQSYISLVLDDAHAGWPMAAAVAQALDKELSISANVERVALALDSKNIVVLLPKHQRDDAASWIRDIERTPILMESNEARVTINRRTGTIVITGDTRMSPVVISQKGMTITVAAPQVDGTIVQPAFEQHEFVALDVEKNRLPNVQDLLQALNRLKVPFADRVSILEEIHRAGKLHARIMYEG